MSAEEGTWTLTSVTLTRTWILLVCQFRHFRKPYEFLQSSYSLMRKMGLEPTRPNGHKILSLARLPIPTLPQTVVFLTTQRYVFYHRYSHKSTVFLNFFNFFLTHEKSSWNCRSQCGRRDLNPHERSAHKNLNLARLPIPTLPHHVWYNTSSWQKCQIFLKCFSKNTFCRF